MPKSYFIPVPTDLGPEYEIDESCFNIDVMKPFIDPDTADIERVSYMLDNVEFDSLDIFIRICMHMEHVIFDEDIEPYLQLTKSKKRARELWDAGNALTPKEALEIVNAEQKMIAIKYIGFEKMMTALDAELLDEEIVEKTQPRWKSNLSPDKMNGTLPLVTTISESMFDKETVTFKDVYRLYKIPGNLVGLTDEDYYGVECDCPSTGRKYFKPVIKHEKAIDAIAWTLYTTRDEYLRMEKES